MKNLKILSVVTIGIISGFLGEFLFSSVTGSYADAKYQNKSISASAFILRDQNGAERGGIKLENGNPAFYLADNGKAFFFVSLFKGRPMLVMSGSQNETRLALAINRDGNPTIQLLSGPEKPSIVIRQTKNGDSMISLCDRNGKPAIFMGVGEENTMLAMLDKDKKPNFLLQNKFDKGTLMTFNSEGKAPYMSLGVMAETPHFMFNQGHRTGGMLGYASNGQPFMSLRENGRITWIEPRGAKPGGGAWDAEIDWSHEIKDMMR